MKNLRLTFALALGFFSGAAILLACTSDDTIFTTTDSGTDAAPESSDRDAEVIDSGTDTGTDGPVLIDAGLTFDTYIGQISDVYCDSLARCCFGDDTLEAGAPVDGGGAFPSGTYDKATCLGVNKKFGFEGSLQGALEANDAGAVKLDQTQALDCIAKVKALKCSLARADFVAVRDACFKSVLGNGTAGSSCSASIQCGPGFFCNTKTAKCEALRAANAPCGDYTDDEGVADEACSWRASGDTNHYCESYDSDGNRLDDAGAWVCKPGRANGSYCNVSAWCASGMCSIAEANSYTCTDPVTYFPRDPSNCGSLVKQ